MSYLDVYKARVGHLGSNPQERAFQSGILEFRRYLKYNQHTVRNLIREKDGSTFDGVILTDKEDENRVSQILLVDLDTNLEKGDLVLWNDEHWLIYQSTTSSYQPHQKFYMVRCNYYIKWIDKGELHESWIYLLGSKDSKIKDNFRTWHNVITPQPNKYINLILPHVTMPINTEIIVLDEAWYLVDYDQNSVPGIVFMSFTETNVNLQRDDLENKIANVDQLNSWSIDAPAEQTVAPKDEVKVDFYVYKNGTLDENAAQDAVFTVAGNVYMSDGKIYATSAGVGYITITVKDASFVQKITVTSEQPAADLVLVGNEKIKVGYDATYVLEGATGEVSFAVSDTKLASVKAGKTANSCVVKANEDNKLGSVVLTAVCNEQIYSKEIKIISLWQVV